MTKKILIGTGLIIVMLLFGTFIFQNHIMAPFAAYQSKQFWKAQEHNLKHDKDSTIVFPKAVGIVNDFSEIFTTSEKTELTEVLYDYNIETSRQIVVVTIDSITPYQDIQKYATDLGNEWGVGMAEKDNGLVIVLCKPCRKIGIATGTGAQTVLTNEICQEVISNVIIPKFKNDEFYNGVKKGVEELIMKWE